MPRLLRSCSILLLLPILSSCVSTKIDSQRDESFVKEIKRVYVYSSVRMDEQALAQAFSQVILPQFGSYGIMARSQVRDPLALDEEGFVTDEVEAFNPDVILVLTQTNASATRTWNPGSMSFHDSAEAVYDVSLYDPETDKRIWRAQISTSRDALMTSQEGAAKKIAEKIINQMAVDRLIGPAAEAHRRRSSS